MRRFQLLLFSFFLGANFFDVTITAKSELSRNSWQIKEYPNRRCRAEDGFHQCTGMDSVEICVLRTNAYNLCKESPVLNCTDDEVRMNKICQPRSAVARGGIYIVCHPDEFRCEKTKRCIPRVMVQDGEVHCSFINVEDDSDEKIVLESCNEKSEHRCPGNPTRCIPRSMVMDGKVDCQDGTDEVTPLTCDQNSEFRCTRNNRCILRRYVNDNFPDCPDGTDENVRNFTCVEDLEFSCKLGRCIPRHWVGNGVKDCTAGEDETAVLGQCYDGEFQCLDRTRCLPIKHLCDGVQNCRDGSDEIEQCDSPTMYRCTARPDLIPWSIFLGDTIQYDYRSHFHTHKISMLGFKCRTHIENRPFSTEDDQTSRKLRAVPQFYVRSNHSVCYNNKDICYDKQGNFVCARCFDGTIISTSQLCDDVIDCRDLSDECTCQESIVTTLCNRIYPSSLMGSEKFNFDMICNGSKDMSDGLDEEFCSYEVMDFEDSTKSHNFTCQDRKNESIIIDIQTKALYCDGTINCSSMEDECSSDCLKPFLNTTTLNYSFPTLTKTCFPFLESFDNGSVRHFRFETVLQNDSSSTGETLKEPQQNVDKNTTCEYELELNSYTTIPFFLLREVNNRKICETQKYYTNLEFLCDIKPCPWLHVCQSDTTKKVKIHKLCDYKSDCEDHSDEKDCDDTHFYCINSKPPFINKSQVADKRSDCGDRSDECKETPYSSIKQMLKSKFLRYFVWFVAISAIVGNVVTIRKHFHKLKTIASKKSIPFWNTTLLLNLAFSDIIFGFILLAIGIQSWKYSGDYCEHDLEWRSSEQCNLIGIFTIISSQTSIHILVVLTGLRLYTTYHPFMANELSLKLLIITSTLSWGISILIAVFPIWDNEIFAHLLYIKPNLFLNDHVVHRVDISRYFATTEVLYSLNVPQNKSVENLGNFHVDRQTQWYFNTKEGKTIYPHRNVDILGSFGFYSSSSVCFPDLYSNSSPAAEYSLFIISYNLASLFFICIGYLVIFNRVKTTHSLTQQTAAEKLDNKITRRIILIILTDIVCWLPIIVMKIISYFGSNESNLPDIVHPISSLVFLPINSLINPIIYSRLDKLIAGTAVRLCRPICKKFRGTENSLIKEKRYKYSSGSTKETRI